MTHSFVPPSDAINRQYDPEEFSKSCSGQVKNSFVVNRLQRMSVTCLHRNNGCYLFPKMLNGRDHSEFLAYNHRASLVRFNHVGQPTQYKDGDGSFRPYASLSNSYGSTIEALTCFANASRTRTDLRYLLLYVGTEHRFQSSNAVPQYGFTRGSDSHYHAGCCVVDFEPVARGMGPTIYYFEPHSWRFLTMSQGNVITATYNPIRLVPIEILGLADILGSSSILVYLAGQTSAPNCSPFTMCTLASIMDGNLPYVNAAHYQIHRTGGGAVQSTVQALARGTKVLDAFEQSLTVPNGLFLPLTVQISPPNRRPQGRGYTLLRAYYPQPVTPFKGASLVMRAYLGVLPQSFTFVQPGGGQGIPYITPTVSPFNI